MLMETVPREGEMGSFGFQLNQRELKGIEGKGWKGTKIHLISQMFLSFSSFSTMPSHAKVLWEKWEYSYFTENGDSELKWVVQSHT